MDITLNFPTKNNHHNHHSFFPSSDDPIPNTSTSRGRSTDSLDAPTAAANTNNSSSDKWAAPLLRECARAIANKDTPRIHHLLWMLNELASPYGDSDQKLSAYFLQSLFCKATSSGPRCFRTLTSVSDKSHSFHSARKHILKFQEVSPWTTFGHVAANGAILEALDGEPRLHIIDISNTLCTQWPTLLESLATRHDDTPHLKLTVVVPAAAASAAAVIKEIGQRMEKFARLMGVPFEFHVVTGVNKLTELTKEALMMDGEDAGPAAAVAINCMGSLRKVEVEERRDVIGRMFRSLSPRVVTVVEEEADFVAEGDFVNSFEECLRYYTVYFEMLEESFAATSNERLLLERECGRNLVRVLGCDQHHHNNEDDHMNSRDEIVGDWDNKERGKQWSVRMREGGYSPVGFSDDVIDDVKALLKRYRPGWSLVHKQHVQLGDDSINDTHEAAPGLFLAWKEEPVVWASAWKP
ncbi:Protein SHORT-ROOT [Linum perenne]